MPQIGNKKFPYTPAGMQAAKNAQLKKLDNNTAKKKPGAPVPIKDAPKPNPNGGLYGPIGKKPRNGIIKVDPRESNGGFNKKPKSPKKNPIMTTLPVKSNKTKKMM